MSTELFLDFIGIRMDSKKAEGMAFTMNLITPDNGEKFAIELSNFRPPPTSSTTST